VKNIHTVCHVFVAVNWGMVYNLSYTEHKSMDSFNLSTANL
jgi:hypothetical protein